MPFPLLLIFCFLLAQLSHPLDLAANERQLKNKKTSLKKKISQGEQEEWSLLEQLRSLNESASKSYERYSKIRNKVNWINNEIRSNKLGVAQLKLQIQEDTKSLSQKFEALYLAKKVRHITLLPGLINFKNFLRNKKLLESSASVDAEVMQQYVDKIILLDETSITLAAQKQELASLLAKRRQHHNAMQWEMREQQDYLNQIQSNQSLQRRYLNEVDHQIQNIGKLTTTSEQTSKAADFSGFRSYKKALPLPLQGKIISSYKKSNNPLFKKGIVIEAKGNKNVESVLTGLVIFAGPYRGFAELVILDHGQGSYSVYGNLKDVALTKGRTVAKGAVIGKVILDSLSGKHLLYFETRYRKRADDPKKWLKASVWK